MMHFPSVSGFQRCQSGLKSGGSAWVKKFRFSREIFEKCRFFQAVLQTKNIDFSRQLFEKFRFFRQFHKKFRFSRKELAIYSYFWANYSISLQTSPLSNIPPVHDKI